MSMTDKVVESKAEQLVHILKSYESVAVAFSGGVDSAVVAKAARLALGDSSIAVTAVSPSLAADEKEIAQQVAEKIGIRHRFIETQEFDNPDYTANAPNRCYFCKTELYSRLTAMIPELKVHVLANGSNVDDQGDWRPGMTAADEHQVRSPLLEAEIDKQQVRLLAKHWDLPIWDKPATPCLSSRIAYGESVTPERVLMIDRAERFLKEQGLTELRVRYHPGDIARIEVPIEDLERLTDPAWRVPLLSYFRTLGFRHITLDLQGFRSGSMNIGTVANTACQSTDMKSSSCGSTNCGTDPSEG
ncbi:MAG: ATP-dependent sacrificial sulfur transferase LarE [Planctomycetes bacterium]|nr:ATP-dependent sacrificial sulfur transferase LarE [Planctomycetota bacterium]